MTIRMARARFIGLFVALLLAACAGPELRNPVPEPLVTASAVPGYSHIRFWGDDGAAIDRRMVEELAQQQRASGNTATDRYFLAVSGGGSNGAFGAGILFGWSAAGTRPEFTVVTGVSTGSLIAPFAFLGPPYDDSLKAAYTAISGKDIFRRRGLFTIIGSKSVADNTPLRGLVEQYVTDKMVSDIAREHARGRRLLIGTTNLDAERPVVWDIGAIASSNVASRKQLIQNILIASSSIPGVFPPLNIKVVADGKAFDEMHVDGGTSNQAFLFPSQFSPRQAANEAGMKRNWTLYVIRNGKVTPEYSAVKPRLAAIVGKSISSLIKTQGIGDLYRMYANARRDGMKFKAIWIPESFTKVEPEPFDRAFMNELFHVGYEMGRNGIPWATHPP
ncbi:MAG: patatin-like phospholipase family protein [Parvibaculaceae bacterium]